MDLNSKSFESAQDIFPIRPNQHQRNKTAENLSTFEKIQKLMDAKCILAEKLEKQFLETHNNTYQLYPTQIFEDDKYKRREFVKGLGRRAETDCDVDQENSSYILFDKYKK